MWLCTYRSAHRMSTASPRDTLEIDWESNWLVRLASMIRRWESVESNSKDYTKKVHSNQPQVTSRGWKTLTWQFRNVQIRWIQISGGTWLIQVIVWLTSWAEIKARAFTPEDRHVQLLRVVLQRLRTLGHIGTENFAITAFSVARAHSL